MATSEALTAVEYLKYLKSYIHIALSNAGSRGNFQLKVYVSTRKRALQAAAFRTLASTDHYTSFYDSFWALHTKCATIERMLQVKPGPTLTNRRLWSSEGRNEDKD